MPDARPFGGHVTETTHAAHHDEAHGEHGSKPGKHAAAHTDHTGHAAMFRRLFWWNLLLAVPVIALSAPVQGWLGYELTFAGSTWVAPVLGTVIYLWGGSAFIRMARPEIQNRRPGMMLLISLAITVAFLSSALTTLGVWKLDFWWELSALVVVMLLGHWQEMKAVGQAHGALAALAQLLPDEAERVVGDATETVPASELVAGDVVVVRPGARVPADGTIVDGSASMDESMITGESAPVRRDKGADVVAGTVATDGSLRVSVTAIGDDTALAGIQRLVAAAQESRSGARVLADRAANALFYIAVGAAIATFVFYAVQGDVYTGTVRAVTVLVIACPHALGLAIPLVVALSTALAAKSGILVKDLLSLERMRLVDAVIFDKTGTLTEGSHVLTEAVGLGDWTEDKVLALAAAAERDSEHPIARAVVAAAEERGLDVKDPDDVETLAGRGVIAKVGGARVAVGGRAILEHLGITAPEEAKKQGDAWAKDGSPVLYVTVDDTVAGLFTTRDPIRAESMRAVQSLQERGVTVALMTGDSEAVANRVGAELGIDRIFAEVLPADKDAAVAKLQDEGHTVAMVGDGVNDAPALARADVGVAIGAGTDVAMEAAGIVLASNDPRAVDSIFRLSRASHKKMIQNLVWATGYNAVAIPAAAGALTWAGITLGPATAAIAMSVSTIVVALNAQLLRRVDLSRVDAHEPSHDHKSERSTS